jgi:hypothetical protein
MKPVMQVAGVATAMLLGAGIGAYALGESNETRVKPGPATPVVIQGGQVEVVAPDQQGLEVTVDLSSLESRLDSLDAAVRQPEPANAFEQSRLFVNNVSATSDDDDFELMYVSSITVTSDSRATSMNLQLRGVAPAANEARQTVWVMGNSFNFTEVTDGVTTVSFPQPIPVTGTHLTCVEVATDRWASIALPRCR